MILDPESEEEVSVYIKSGLIGKFSRKGLLKGKDETLEWTDKVDDYVGRTIAFRYEGEEYNKKTKRKFQSYKVLFPEDLETALSEAK